MLVLIGERSAWMFVAAVASSSYFGCHGGDVCYATGRGEVTNTKLLMGVSVCLSGLSICCAWLNSRSSVINPRKLSLKLHMALRLDSVMD